jgi:hypothetical protein
VNNTVGNEDIRDDDAGTIYKDLSANNGDSQVGTVDSLERSSVLEAAAVADSSGNNVVGKDAGDLLNRKVGKTGADSLESSIARGEDGDVLGGVDSLDKLGSSKSTGKRRKTGSDGGVGSSFGDGENSVNNVDNTAGEGNILRRISGSSGS